MFLLVITIVSVIKNKEVFIMDAVYDQQDFDNISFVQLLEEDGFDIFNIGIGHL